MSKPQVSIAIKLTLGEGMAGHEEQLQEALGEWLEEHMTHTVHWDLAQQSGLPLVGITVDDIKVDLL